MKRKLLLWIAIGITVVAGAAGFAACGGNGGAHKHSLAYHAAEAATCTENGNIEYWSCSGCGKNFSDQEGEHEVTNVTIAAAGHAWSGWETEQEATCIREGIRVRSCERCKTTEEETIPKTEHHYETAYDDSEHWKECSVCGDKKDEGEHRYRNDVCTVCGKLSYTEGLSYALDEANQTYAVTGIGEAEETKIVFPSAYNGLPVTAVGENAFRGGAITSVVFSDSVTFIAEGAFAECALLETVTLSENLAEISDNAFSGCSSLTEITIPDGVSLIGSDAFSGCTNLTEAAFPAFAAEFIPKENLQSVTVTSGDIGEHAFENCVSLASVTIGENVSSVGDYAFHNCTGITEIRFNAAKCADKEGGMTYTFTYAGQEKDGITVYIGANVTRMPAHLFTPYNIRNDSYKPNITRVVFEEGSRCASMGKAAFGNVRTIEAVYLTDLSAWCGIEFEDAQANPLIAGGGLYLDGKPITHLVLPGDVTEIKDYAFGHCTSFESVEIGGNITSIGVNAFIATNLRNVSIPGSVLSIGADAFYGCDLLESVQMGSGVLSVGEYAFYGCTSLESVTLSESLTTLRDNAFLGCSKLKTISLPQSITAMGMWIFASCSSLETIEVPENITIISIGMFSNCSSLETVTMPKVDAVRNNAFYNCSSLKTVYFGGSESDWDNINDGGGNEYLFNADIRFGQ